MMHGVGFQAAVRHHLWGYLGSADCAAILKRQHVEMTALQNNVCP